MVRRATAFGMRAIWADPVAAGAIPPELLALDSKVTDCNSAFFDVAHDFHGCIAGCHEVLRRQGLLEGIWCLDPQEGLFPGQASEISRVIASRFSRTAPSRSHRERRPFLRSARRRDEPPP